MDIIEISNILWGLNTAEPTKIKDNEMSVLENMSYNADYQLQSRYWLAQFGNQIGTNAITSLFSFKNDTTWASYLLATAGTSLYQYNSSTGNYDQVKTGLSEFEADWVTRTKWSFAVYLNKVYMCNWVDDYAEYDPATTTYTVLATQPKVRYLAYLWDAIYGAGQDSNPITLYYTNAGASDGRTLNANFIVVWGDESGRIKGLEELQTQVQVFKEYSIYSVSGDGSTAYRTDVEDGWYSHRAIKKVENSLVNLNSRGIDSLKARDGVSSTQAIRSSSLSDNVRSIFSKIQAKNRENSSALYVPELTNYYVTLDTNNDGIPETTLVYSTLTKGWSKYTYPAISDFTRYIDSDGVIHNLASSANTGIVYEIEKWFSDVGANILPVFKTKRYDFKKPYILKTFDFVDIYGYKTRWDSITCNIYIERNIEAGATITDDFVDTTSETYKIGQLTTWTNVIGGAVGTEDTVELFPFYVRIPMYVAGANIEVELTSNSENLLWSVDKIILSKNDENIQLFSYHNII